MSSTSLHNCAMQDRAILDFLSPVPKFPVTYIFSSFFYNRLFKVIASSALLTCLCSAALQCLQGTNLHCRRSLCWRSRALTTASISLRKLPLVCLCTDCEQVFVRQRRALDIA